MTKPTSTRHSAGHGPNRRLLLRGALLLPTALAGPAARACDFTTTYLRVTHPWARASGPGEFEALIGMTIDEVSRDERLVGVETPLARGSTMVTPDNQRAALALALPAGSVTVLEDGATRVLLTGLLQPLQVGRDYPLTLHFEHSAPVMARLNVDYQRFG